MGTDKGVIEVFWYDLSCPHLMLTHRGALKHPPQSHESFESYACSPVSTSEMIDPELKCQDGRVKPAVQQ
jgi:hypothetical protein